MKNFFTLLLCVLACTACESPSKKTELSFATCADYPPFEYVKDGQIVGLDADIAKAIAKEMGMPYTMKDMPFDGLLPSLQNGMIDAVVATMTVTEERAKNFDFTDTYYNESLAVVYRKDTRCDQDLNVHNLAGKKLACQIGTTMAIWVKENVKDVELIVVDTNPAAIESLKAGNIDGVVVDLAQAQSFCDENPGLHFNFLAQSNTGYAVMLKKGSSLLPKINKAIKALKNNGTINALIQKHIPGDMSAKA